MLSISWERQAHIPIMTSVGREEERAGRREGRIVIAQRLSIHQRKAAEAGMTIDQRSRDWEQTGRLKKAKSRK